MDRRRDNDARVEIDRMLRFVRCRHAVNCAFGLTCSASIWMRGALTVATVGDLLIRVFVGIYTEVVTPRPPLRPPIGRGPPAPRRA